MELVARPICVVFVILHLSLGVPLAWTSAGNFRGTVQDFGKRQVEVFAGIPFAKPALKLNRFRPPEKLKRSPLISRFAPFGVIKYPASCVQSPATNTSEDCLYLSVWRRQGTIAINRKPVVVIIHDGGFYRGSGHGEWHGNALAALGDVIVVGFNYRLGVLGFLDLGVHGAEGSVGLEDKQLALGWVHDHTSGFGGDRHNIILLGTEAGASSAIYHINQTSSRYQGAIVDLLWSPPDDKRTLFERGLEVSKNLNCSGGEPEAIAFCLRTQSVETLAGIGQIFHPNISIDVRTNGLPVVVGFAVPGSRNVALASVCKTLRWAESAAEAGSSVNLFLWRKNSAALLEFIGSALGSRSGDSESSQDHNNPAIPRLNLTETVREITQWESSNHSLFWTNASPDTESNEKSVERLTLANLGRENLE
ncbi:acetylcholinesterase-like [Galendromus occidentalis]|uniref:Acetylcholinesterase-like n=1 Tax=Galendromus occidentalis TaxID=34638 RepID=A0AAJ6QN83_9ACAR|nr:acetylcholinesterase-like [Galendromus occidentalis]